MYTFVTNFPKMVNERKCTKMKKLFYIGALSALFLTACGEETATVNPDEFKQLEKGMSYDEVKEVVGGKPNNPDDKENEDLLLSLEYDGENGIEKESSVSLIFKDGKLDTILEDGLTEERKELTEDEKKQIAENTSKIQNKISVENVVKSVTSDEFEVILNDGIASITIENKKAHEGSKSDMLKVSAEIFAGLSKLVGVTSATIKWHAPLTDQYGNEKMDEVLSIMMDGDTFAKVNWANYESLDLEVIAPGFKQHDALND